jgi:hypothetical protein
MGMHTLSSLPLQFPGSFLTPEGPREFIFLIFLVQINQKSIARAKEEYRTTPMNSTGGRKKGKTPHTENQHYLTGLLWTQVIIQGSFGATALQTTPVWKKNLGVCKLWCTLLRKCTLCIFSAFLY